MKRICTAVLMTDLETNNGDMVAGKDLSREDVEAVIERYNEAHQECDQMLVLAPKVTKEDPGK